MFRSLTTHVSPRGGETGKEREQGWRIAGSKSACERILSRGAVSASTRRDSNVSIRGSEDNKYCSVTCIARSVARSQAVPEASLRLLAVTVLVPGCMAVNVCQCVAVQGVQAAARTWVRLRRCVISQCLPKAQQRGAVADARSRESWTHIAVGDGASRVVHVSLSCEEPKAGNMVACRARPAAL